MNKPYNYDLYSYLLIAATIFIFLITVMYLDKNSPYVGHPLNDKKLIDSYLLTIMCILIIVCVVFIFIMYYK